MKKKIFILIFLLAKCVFADSQAPVFNVERYTTVNGLTDNAIFEFLQDSRGFLWIAAGNGLNRYDGKVFKQYNSFGKNGLTDLSVTCLAEDNEGNIWIGTANGLNKLNPFTEVITHYYEGSGPGTIPYKWCNCLYVDKSKNLWVSTEKGVALFDKRSNSFQNFPVSVYGADARINKFIDRILEDSKGRFWLATSYGIKLFDRDKKTYLSFHFPETKGESLNENGIISLYEDRNSNIWAGSWGGNGLFRFNEKKNIFEKVIIKNPPAASIVVSGITEIQTRNAAYLLLAVNGVLFYLEEKDGVNKLVTVAQENRHGFSTTAFNNLLNNGKGTIWAGGYNGLYKINSSGQPVQWVSFSNHKIGDNYVYHIIPDIKRPQDIYYLSTIGGWWRYGAGDQKITRMFLPANENKLLRYINNWLPDEHGYWFTSVEGFGYYDIYQNRLTDLTSLIKENSGQTNTGFIAKDNKGKIWLTMRRYGILVYDPVIKKTWSLFADSTKADNIFGRSATDLVCGKNGNIYFCVYNKLYSVDPTDFSYRIIRAPSYEEQIDETKTGPEKIAFTTDNRTLVSSRLRVYELKNNKLVTIFPQSGLSSFTIEKIIAGEGNSIWIATSKGVFKTDTAFRKWTIISSETAKEESDFSQMAIGPQEILFNGKGSIGILKDSLLPKSTGPPVVIINRIKYGQKQNYLVSIQPVNINSSYKDAIEIELSAIDFINEKENRILYKLDGWDKDWREITGAAIVRYDQLPPGSYVFKAKTVNTEGGESKETMLNFSVIPPFYRTWWFITFIVMLLGAATFLFYRFRLKKALELERMRTRIATDLHDDIGATLSSISLYSQAVKSQLKGTNPQLENVLDKMGENSRDMVNSMSDIVWAINPNNDDGEKLIKRMESYAADMCAVKNIRLHFKTDEKFNEVTLPLAHRKNIYLIFKEAMNNAVKYADAADIWVAIELHNKKLDMLIRDNGKGFIETAIKEGNGLKSLRARAIEIKGAMKINTVTGEGTAVSLHCLI